MRSLYYRELEPKLCSYGSLLRQLIGGSLCVLLMVVQHHWTGSVNIALLAVY